MRPSGDRRADLGHRLRELRQDYEINQAELAEALGVGAPSVSTWESGAKIPPVSRLNEYATFFATERSVMQEPYRLPPLGELTADERARRDELLRELKKLRAAATGSTVEEDVADRPVERPRNLWDFPDDEDVMIVCARLSDRLIAKAPYADRKSPDYSQLFTCADPDSLIEAFGHIRAFNPNNRVRFRVGGELTEDDYTSHLILIGGVDFNYATSELLGRFAELPVRQFARDTDTEVSGFEVDESGHRREFMPKFRADGAGLVLEEDIAHVFWAVNPYNRTRTVTVCNGQFSRGVLGAVRAIADARFRDRNMAYAAKFAGLDAFSILSRVIVLGSRALTPDWTNADSRLHEWPAVAGG
jgi:transcriptional regulator with XRE-family HTH domain